jgi:hypothetical protein
VKEKGSKLDLLVAESWLNAYHLSIAGLVDLTLESGPENNFRAKLLHHNCFLALNATIMLDTVSIINKDFDLKKL